MSHPPNAPHRAREVFLDAIEHHPPADWPEYLDSACDDDDALRREVERLLDVHQQLNSFMAEPAAGLEATVPVPAPEPLGAQIGPYKLRELIGEGGMGVVYVAEQERPIRRKVALKIIKPGMDSREVLARFAAERQALALMDHPNIARALDAGATGVHAAENDVGVHALACDASKTHPEDTLKRELQRGRPYFVMELVRGLPITEFCDQRKLATRERLELFVQVCSAIQHAHQKGIIHRDIKPSNVLVTLHDDQPVPKVIDFGVAKAINQRLTEQTVYTAFAQMLGTPLYMSPEQAEMNALDVDTRSDVYSLGVLLYELLTGVTPFDQQTLKQAGFDEMRRIIREVEPPRPSDRLSTLEADTASTLSQRRGLDPRQLRQLLRGELDWIVMKALEKDRTRRYESASAFAGDVRRYLDYEPVDAHPPSALYRVRTFARKRKALLGVSSLVVATMLMATGFSTWQAAEARQARGEADRRLITERRALGRAVAAAQAEAEQQRRARRNLGLALDAADDMYYRLATTWIADEGVPSETQQDFLDKAIALYAQLVANPAAYELSDARIAELFGRIALIHHESLRYAEAAAALQQAVAIQQNLLDQEPASLELCSSLAWSLNALGAMENLAGLTDSAERRFSAALEHYRRLAAAQPEEPQHRIGVARATHNLAGMQFDRGRHSEAERLAREASALYEKFGHDGLADLGEEVNYFSNRSLLAHQLLAQAKPQEAEPIIRDALNLCHRRLFGKGDDRDYRKWHAKLLGDLAAALLAQDRSAEAEATIRQQLQAQVELLPERRDPATFLDDVFVAAAAGNDQPEAWNEWAMANLRLASILRRRNQLHEAELLLARTIQVMRYASIMYGHVFPYRVSLSNAYAETALLLRERYPKEANDHAEEAADTWRSLLREFPRARNYKSGLYYPATDLAWFTASFPECELTDLERDEPPDAAPPVRREFIPEMRATALIEFRYGNWADAATNLERLIGRRQGEGALDQFYLSICLSRQGKIDEARRWLEAGKTWMEKFAPADETLLRLRDEAQKALDQAAAEKGSVARVDTFATLR